jgi:hypothetical protein
MDKHAHGETRLSSRAAPRACDVVVQGTRVGDMLSGGPVGDKLLGLGGNDVLKGFGGDDCLWQRRAERA